MPPDSLVTLRLAAALFLAGFLVFSSTLGYEFVWDDVHIVSYTREIVEGSGPASLLTAPFIARPDDPSDTSGYYRPISFLSMWVNDPVGQPTPFLYHLFNVLVHGTNCVLVFLLLQKLLPSGRGAFPGGMLFALHPVHAESVAFISGRTDLMAALFGLAAALLWVNSRKGPWRWTSYLAGMVAFALACLSKEIAFVLPVALFSWITMSGQPLPSGRKGFSRRDLVWIGGMFLILGILLFIRLEVLGIGLRSSSLGSGPAIPALLKTVGANVATYLRLLMFPWPLAVYYPPSELQLSYFNLLVALGVLGSGALLAGRHHRRLGISALLWTVVFLGPVSGVIGLGLSDIAERFCYLPSVGIVAIAGYALTLLWQRTGRRMVLSGLTGILFLVMALATFNHASKWKNEVVFFSNAVERGSVPNMYFNLGNALVHAGQPLEGIVAFKEAVSIRPGYLDALLNMGSTHIKVGQYEKALQVFTEAVKLHPGEARLWVNMGITQNLMERYEDALGSYGRAVELDPLDFEPALYAGNLLTRLGRHSEALENYRKVLSLQPEHLKALSGTGHALEELSRFGEAGDVYLDGLEHHPNEAILYVSLGRTFLERGRAREAEEVFRAALDISPGNVPAYRGLVLSIVKQGDLARAKEHVDRIRGDDPGLLDELEELLQKLEGSKAE